MLLLLLYYSSSTDSLFNNNNKDLITIEKIKNFKFNSEVDSAINYNVK